MASVSQILDSVKPKTYGNFKQGLPKRQPWIMGFLTAVSQYIQGHSEEKPEHKPWVCHFTMGHGKNSIGDDIVWVSDGIVAIQAILLTKPDSQGFNDTLDSAPEGALVKLREYSLKIQDHFGRKRICLMISKYSLLDYGLQGWDDGDIAEVDDRFDHSDFVKLDKLYVDSQSHDNTSCSQLDALNQLTENQPSLLSISVHQSEPALENGIVSAATNNCQISSEENQGSEIMSESEKQKICENVYHVPEFILKTREKRLFNGYDAYWNLMLNLTGRPLEYRPKEENVWIELFWPEMQQNPVVTEDWKHHWKNDISIMALVERIKQEGPDTVEETMDMVVQRYPELRNKLAENEDLVNTESIDTESMLKGKRWIRKSNRIKKTSKDSPILVDGNNMNNNAHNVSLDLSCSDPSQIDEMQNDFDFSKMGETIVDKIQESAPSVQYHSTQADDRTGPDHPEYVLELSPIRKTQQNSEDLRLRRLSLPVIRMEEEREANRLKQLGTSKTRSDSFCTIEDNASSGVESAHIVSNLENHRSSKEWTGSINTRDISKLEKLAAGHPNEPKKKNTDNQIEKTNKNNDDDCNSCEAMSWSTSPGTNEIQQLDKLAGSANVVTESSDGENINVSSLPESREIYKSPLSPINCSLKAVGSSAIGMKVDLSPDVLFAVRKGSPSPLTPRRKRRLFKVNSILDDVVENAPKRAKTGHNPVQICKINWNSEDNDESNSVVASSCHSGQSVQNDDNQVEIQQPFTEPGENLQKGLLNIPVSKLSDLAKDVASKNTKIGQHSEDSNIHSEVSNQMQSTTIPQIESESPCDDDVEVVVEIVEQADNPASETSVLVSDDTAENGGKNNTLEKSPNEQRNISHEEEEHILDICTENQMIMAEDACVPWREQSFNSSFEGCDLVTSDLTSIGDSNSLVTDDFQSFQTTSKSNVILDIVNTEADRSSLSENLENKSDQKRSFVSRLVSSISCILPTSEKAGDNVSEISQPLIEQEVHASLQEVEMRNDKLNESSESIEIVPVTVLKLSFQGQGDENDESQTHPENNVSSCLDKSSDNLLVMDFITDDDDFGNDDFGNNDNGGIDIVHMNNDDSNLITEQSRSDCIEHFNSVKIPDPVPESSPCDVSEVFSLARSHMSENEANDQLSSISDDICTTTSEASTNIPKLNEESQDYLDPTENKSSGAASTYGSRSLFTSDSSKTNSVAEENNKSACNGVPALTQSDTLMHVSEIRDECLQVHSQPDNVKFSVPHKKVCCIAVCDDKTDPCQTSFNKSDDFQHSICKSSTSDSLDDSVQSIHVVSSCVSSNLSPSSHASKFDMSQCTSDAASEVSQNNNSLESASSMSPIYGMYSDEVYRRSNKKAEDCNNDTDGSAVVGIPLPPPFPLNTETEDLSENDTSQHSIRQIDDAHTSKKRVRIASGDNESFEDHSIPSTEASDSVCYQSAGADTMADCHTPARKTLSISPCDIQHRDTVTNGSFSEMSVSDEQPDVGNKICQERVHNENEEISDSIDESLLAVSIQQMDARSFCEQPFSQDADVSGCSQAEISPLKRKRKVVLRESTNSETENKASEICASQGFQLHSSFCEEEFPQNSYVSCYSKQGGDRDSPPCSKEGETPRSSCSTNIDISDLWNEVNPAEQLGQLVQKRDWVKAGTSGLQKTYSGVLDCYSYKMSPNLRNVAEGFLSNKM